MQNHHASEDNVKVRDRGNRQELKTTQNTVPETSAIESTWRKTLHPFRSSFKHLASVDPSFD